MRLTAAQIQDFQITLQEAYARYGRADLPWRRPEPDGGFDPYKIFVSELMLQQTQVPRVIPKYQTFLELFPDVQQLAGAELGTVLRAWQGLGYNRRAKYLWLAAKDLAGKVEFPRTAAELTRLPGIGSNTAGAILAYAFNQPAVFIETNIRTVYIHHFFHDQTGVTDKEILELVEQTLDSQNPREWYWQLMDYGSHLKMAVGNLNRAGKGYAKQSKFHGSQRQIRGQVIRELSESPKSQAELARLIADERLPAVLQALVAEGLVQQKAGSFSLD
jgi:A/G-specific adenine glycosylase